MTELIKKIKTSSHYNFESLIDIVGFNNLQRFINIKDKTNDTILTRLCRYNTYIAEIYINKYYKYFRDSKKKILKKLLNSYTQEWIVYKYIVLCQNLYNVTDINYFYNKNSNDNIRLKLINKFGLVILNYNPNVLYTITINYSNRSSRIFEEIFNIGGIVLKPYLDNCIHIDGNDQIILNYTNYYWINNKILFHKYINYYGILSAPSNMDNLWVGCSNKIILIFGKY
jgi:hypothetical protein